MRIIDNADTTKEFRAINVGECFYYDNSLCIKIHPIKEERHVAVCNAFCFIDNTVCHIPDDWSVTPINAEIIIRSKGVE